MKRATQRKVPIMSNRISIFGGLEKKKIDLLIKILSQMDSDNEGVQISAMLAADKLLKKEGFRWAEVTRAIEVATGPMLAAPGLQNIEKRSPTGNREDIYSPAPSQNPKRDYFRPGRMKAFVINAVYNQGYMSIVLRLEDRIIKAKITDRAEAHFFYNKKGSTIEATISVEGKKWSVKAPK